PPVFPVLVGGDNPLADARIEHVALRQTPFDDAPVSLRADITSTATSGPFRVNIRGIDGTSGGELPPMRELVPDGDGKASVGFSWRPDATGLHFVEIGLESEDPAAEATLLNNRRIIAID